MKTTKYPRGWNEARVRRVLEHYESQTDEEAAAEIESGLTRTTMEIPTPLVPVVRELIAKRKSVRRPREDHVNLASSQTNSALLGSKEPTISSMIRPRAVRHEIFIAREFGLFLQLRRSEILCRS